MLTATAAQTELDLKDTAPVGTPAVDAGVRTAAVLAAVETGLGSVLHAFRVPFSGFFLSLNQIFFLSRLSFVSRQDADARSLPASVSTLVALLKSLSPAGKRLTPMLGICAQGVFFNAGTLVLGRNLLGSLVGAVLAALWGVVQPLAIYALVFGSQMLHVAEMIARDVAKVIPTLTPEFFVRAAVGIVALKIVLACALVVAARFASPAAFARYEAALVRAGRAGHARVSENLARADASAAAGEPLVSKRAAARGALRDLASPLYLVSLVVGVFFFAFVESSAVAAIWLAARFLAVGFVVFFLVRVVPLERLLARVAAREPGARGPGALARFAQRGREVVFAFKKL